MYNSVLASGSILEVGALTTLFDIIKPVQFGDYRQFV